MEIIIIIIHFVNAYKARSRHMHMHKYYLGLLCCASKPEDRLQVGISDGGRYVSYFQRYITISRESINPSTDLPVSLQTASFNEGPRTSKICWISIYRPTETSSGLTVQASSYLSIVYRKFDWISNDYWNISKWASLKPGLLGTCSNTPWDSLPDVGTRVCLTRRSLLAAAIRVTRRTFYLLHPPTAVPSSECWPTMLWTRLGLRGTALVVH